MKILILLLTITTIAPTLLDRSDLLNQCETVGSQRSISAESINNGFVQATVHANSVSAIGVVDNKTTTYPSCNEFGERFFSAGWIISATISSADGLSVIQNGRTIFVQHTPFERETGTIKIRHQGSSLQFFLNDRLIFTSQQRNISSRDLRGYYFGVTESPLIGVQQRPAVLRKLTWLGNPYW